MKWFYGLIAAAVLPLIGFAASADLPVTQQIGSDTTPPTTPSFISALAVSSDQIDLEWSTSTDSGVGLEGYLLFRDAVQIANLATTTYSDTGLSAETTYEYYVIAYDFFGNQSSSSATSTVTTPAIPEPPAPPEFVPAGREQLVPIPLEFSKLSVSSESRRAVISIETPGFVVATVKFGVTPQYELGSVSRSQYKTAHDFVLSDLTPNLRYYFSVTIRNQRGEQLTINDSFITQSEEVVVLPPENVSAARFERLSENSVRISWRNPDTSRFDRVRIVANPNFYPLDPTEGELIFEGRATSFLHQLGQRSTDEMYYTIFTLTQDGQYSSGVIGFVSWPSVLPPRIPAVDTVPTSSPPLFPDGGEIDEGTANLFNFSHVEFIQDNRVRISVHGEVRLDPAVPTTIRVPYEVMPETLKVITVTLTPASSTEVFSFLLRRNEDGSYYEATIGPLRNQAIYSVTISLLDFRTGKVTVVSGVIDTVPQSALAHQEPLPDFWQYLWYMIVWYWWWWVIVLCLLVFAYMLSRESSSS